MRTRTVCTVTLLGILLGATIVAVFVVPVSPRPLDNTQLNAFLAAMARGDRLLRTEDFDSAVAAFTDAIRIVRIGPADPEPYYQRGVAHRRRGDFDKAIADCTKAIRINPNYVDAYEMRALAYEDRGDFDKAIADCTKAIRINPNYGDAYERRALVYEDMGELNQAIADYTAAIHCDTQSSHYYFRGNA